MADYEQCASCGAVLLPEDTFCGECGAPRAAATASPAPEVGEAAPAPAERPEATAEEPDPAAVRPAPPTRTGWRVAFVALVVVGVLVCVLGILAFLLAGLSEMEGWTAGENWLFSTLCCLLPIAGSGLVLMLAGLGIWFSRLRDS